MASLTTLRWLLERSRTLQAVTAHDPHSNALIPTTPQRPRTNETPAIPKQPTHRHQYYYYPSTSSTQTRRATLRTSHWRVPRRSMPAQPPLPQPLIVVSCETPCAPALTHPPRRYCPPGNSGRCTLRAEETLLRAITTLSLSRSRSHTWIQHCSVVAVTLALTSGARCTDRVSPSTLRTWSRFLAATQCSDLLSHHRCTHHNPRYNLSYSDLDLPHTPTPSTTCSLILYHLPPSTYCYSTNWSLFPPTLRWRG